MLDLKKLRVRLDYLGQVLSHHKTSSELTLAWRSTYMTKAWLGQALATQGVASPYVPVDKEEDIPPTADTHEKILYTDGSRLEVINELRSQLGIISSELWDEFMNTPDAAYAKTITQAHTYATEARMYLGFELANMYEATKV